MTTYAKRKLKYSRNENFNLLHYVKWDRIVTLTGALSGLRVTLSYLRPMMMIYHTPDEQANHYTVSGQISTSPGHFKLAPNVWLFQHPVMVKSASVLNIIDNNIKIKSIKSNQRKIVSYDD